MAGEVKVLQFSEGVSTGAPTQVGVTATNLGTFANDAAYVADKGSAAANGDTYYNTTVHKQRTFTNGTWRSIADLDKTETFSNKSFDTVTSFTDTTQSTTKDTGAIVTEGGVGIEKNLNVGGNAVITGDLTINGDFTVVNTSVLEVEDANILVNNGGNQATANSNVAGFTVEMSDATHARVGYDSTLTSKFKAGEVGSESEVVTTGHTQSLSNKTLGNTNTLNIKDTLFTIQNDADTTKQFKFEASGITTATTRTLAIPNASTTIVGTDVTQTLTNKTISSGIVTTALTFNAQAELRLADSDSSNYVGYKSPATVATNVIVTLPDSAPTSDSDIMIINNSLVASYVPNSPRNKIRNGGFRIWQRGDSITYSNSRIGPDNFGGTNDFGSSATLTRQLHTTGQTDVPGNPKYFMRFTQGGVAVNLLTWVHDITTVAGKTFVFDFWAKGTVPLDVSGEFNLGSGGAGSAPSISQTSISVPSISTSWQHFIYKFTFGNLVASSTVGTNSFLRLYFSTNTGTGSGTIDLSQVNFTEGATLQRFTHGYEEESAELNICQDQYEKSYNYSVNPGSSTEIGSEFFIGRGVDEFRTIQYKKAKIQTPVVTVYSTTGAANKWRDLSAGVDKNALDSHRNGLHNFTSGDNDALTAGNVLAFQWTSDAALA